MTTRVVANLWVGDRFHFPHDPPEGRILVVSKVRFDGDDAIVDGEWLGESNRINGYRSTVEWTTPWTTEVELA